VGRGEVDGDCRGYRSAEEQARELTRSIRREVSKLSEQWNALIDRSDLWQRRLADTINVSLTLIFVSVLIIIIRVQTRASMIADRGTRARSPRLN
jgi:hypothetical protein